MCIVVLTVEPYVLMGGLKVTNEHNLYILVDPHMVDDISFEEFLEALHKSILMI